MSNEVGLRLRQARIGKKLSTNDVAQALKIRKPFIEAIEAGDYKDLPGMAYTVGFIKSYADMVGLNGEELASSVRRDAFGLDRGSRIEMPHAHESALPGRKVILLSLLVLLVAYIVWYNISGYDRVEREVQVVPESFRQDTRPETDGEMLEEVPAVPSAQDQPEPESEPQSQSQSVTEPVPPVETAVVEKVEVRENLPAVAPEIKARRYGSEVLNPRIEIRVKDDAWVQMQKDGEVLISKVLYTGDSYVIADYDGGLAMDTGNAGGLEIWVDGARIRPIGAGGVIIRGFTFDRDSLDRYAR